MSWIVAPSEPTCRVLPPRLWFSAQGFWTQRAGRQSSPLRLSFLAARGAFWSCSSQSQLGSASLTCAAFGAAGSVAQGRRHMFHLAGRRWGRLRFAKEGPRAASGTPMASLSELGQQADHTWLQQLSPDPETELHAPNKRCREVHSGHYVRVEPTPLSSPALIIHSPAVAQSLGISEETVASEDFVTFFSGDQRRVELLDSWCTPYALAIMGQRQFSNCPFGNGNGYGDGRAISVGEVLVNGQRWEMQLKGAGTTPFCRRFDGRAVLRSSIREFLASEAMHNLGVETTRALALVVSGTESVQRQWYSESGMETVIQEPCAIATRVAPSFLRVGHIDLFARRAVGSSATEADFIELSQIVEHALFREYPDVACGQPLAERAVGMLEAMAEKLGAMVAGWLRVGFCQGNFNADNCLIGGRTMDYGPFGWMDKYDPLFAKWVGSGQHYAFLNQPGAAFANYYTLVTSVAPLLGKDAQPQIVELIQEGNEKIQASAKDAFRLKMGFGKAGVDTAAALWEDLEPLMRCSDIDYTIFWRQLAAVAEHSVTSEGSIITPIMQAFYVEPSAALVSRWTVWLRSWFAAVVGENCDGTETALLAARLRAANPKYIPREWMLADAYSEALDGNYEFVHELYALFLKPYDEQPEFEHKYYRRAPEEVLKRGGLAYMS